jgi:ATP-binding cassette, subfamily B, bacterial
MSPSQKRSGKLPFRYFARTHWKALTLALIAVVGESAADVAEPWPIKVIVDNVLQTKKLPGLLGHLSGFLGSDKYATLNFAVAAVLVIAIVGAISAYSEKYLTMRVSQWIGHDLRLLLYQHMQRLSLAEHGRTRTGDLIARVTKDIDTLQDFINSALLGIVANLLMLLGMIGVMTYVSWHFTLLALSIAPILFAVIYGYTRRIKAASRAVRKKESELLSGAAEALASIHLVQAFAREDYQQRRFESDSREQVEAGLQARGLKARLSPMVDVTVAVGTALVLAYGARLAFSGEISVGMLIIFLSYIGKMYKPIKDLSKMSDTVSKASVGYERIREILDIESDVRDLPDAREAPPFEGLIELDHVSFGYDAASPILKDVSIRVSPGQVAAIVGPSGAGKTTILSLIPRFYDPAAGHVRIDGHDVREFTLKSLRDRISFVLQDTVLFRATIWENIAYGRPDADPEETIRAAQLANAHDFIMQLPHGYGTMVGERGSTLSGGQRQRIAIARAFVRNTPLLILDEPTSGLDANSEHAVMDALQALMKGRTCVLIAHHLSTIRNADVIFVIDEARVVEQGTHETLLAGGGRYAQLYQLQMSGTAAVSE